MRPTNALERRVEALAASLKDLTPAQRAWGLSHVIPHYCIYRTRSRKAVCVTCGYTWTQEDPKICPRCGMKLSLAKDTRQRRFTERGWYGVIQRKSEFTVVRIFHVHDSRKLGDPKVFSYMEEVLQHWIDENGTDTIRARSLTMFHYYRYCPFALYSDLSLKRVHGRYFRPGYYHIHPDAFYPRRSVSPKLRRNGFRGAFKGINAEDLFCALLSDNRFETIWKLGREDLAGKYLYGERTRISKYWKSVLQVCRHGYIPKDVSVWLDYLDLLEYFGMDLSSPRYLMPANLDAEHDRLERRKREILDRQDLDRRKREEKDQLAVLDGKSRYFDITFGDGDLFVVVLKNLEEYKREGDMQHHCVYTNSYYGKKDSLVLSARSRDDPDRPVETVEISLSSGKILQCFGKCNQFTERHDEILALVNDNIHKFLKQ